MKKIILPIPDQETFDRYEPIFKQYGFAWYIKETFSMTAHGITYSHVRLYLEEGKKLMLIRSHRPTSNFREHHSIMTFISECHQIIGLIPIDPELIPSFFIPPIN